MHYVWICGNFVEVLIKRAKRPMKRNKKESPKKTPVSMFHPPKVPIHILDRGGVLPCINEG